jgi:hypothetical protein
MGDLAQRVRPGAAPATRPQRLGERTVSRVGIRRRHAHSALERHPDEVDRRVADVARLVPHVETDGFHPADRPIRRGFGVGRLRIWSTASAAASAAMPAAPDSRGRDRAPRGARSVSLPSRRRVPPSRAPTRRWAGDCRRSHPAPSPGAEVRRAAGSAHPREIRLSRMPSGPSPACLRSGRGVSCTRSPRLRWANPLGDTTRPSLGDRLQTSGSPSS